MRSRGVFCGRAFCSVEFFWYSQRICKACNPCLKSAVGRQQTSGCYINKMSSFLFIWQDENKKSNYVKQLAYWQLGIDPVFHPALNRPCDTSVMINLTPTDFRDSTIRLYKLSLDSAGLYHKLHFSFCLSDLLLARSGTQTNCHLFKKWKLPLGTMNINHNCHLDQLLMRIAPGGKWLFS